MYHAPHHNTCRPVLAHANTAARQLFEVRSDRQLQLVMEAQVQQDAMLAMLLQVGACVFWGGGGGL